MKKLLLTSIAALLLAGSAQAAEKCVNPDGTQDPVCAERNDEDWGGEPRQRVTVAPPLPLHWVGSMAHTRCAVTHRAVLQGL